LNFLTRRTGKLPLGIWIVIIILVFDIFLGVVGQLITIISFETALSLGLQEDNPNSDDPIQRTLVPVEWGVAVADVILQTIGIILALIGIFRRHWVGLMGATVVFTILLYASLFFFFQRYGLEYFQLTDWAHWRGVAIGFLVGAGLMGLVGLISLWSNREYFLS